MKTKTRSCRRRQSARTNSDPAIFLWRIKFTFKAFRQHGSIWVTTFARSFTKATQAAERSLKESHYEHPQIVSIHCRGILS